MSLVPSNSSTNRMRSISNPERQRRPMALPRVTARHDLLREKLERESRQALPQQMGSKSWRYEYAVFQTGTGSVDSNSLGNGLQVRLPSWKRTTSGARC